MALILTPWAFIVLAWYAVRASGLINPGLIPAPHAVAGKAWELFVQENLARDMWTSTRRVCRGGTRNRLCCSRGLRARLVQAGPGLHRPHHKFLPGVAADRPIPLVIVYFGVDELAKVVILFYASFFAGVIVMYEGIAQISPLYVRVARTLGATDLEIFAKVIVPLTVPHILTALRVALGVAWATLVASELIAAQQGLGALIQNASAYFLLDVIYVGIICIGLIALLMDLALRRASARLVAWQERI